MSNEQTTIQASDAKHSPIPDPRKFAFKIKPWGRDEELPGEVTVDPRGVEICLAGYGTYEMASSGPIYLEIDPQTGHPVIHIWSDINRADPTHSISLEGAHGLNLRDEDD